MEPDNTRYLYVYAVAIAETQPEKAIKLLEVSLEKHSGNMDVLMALSSYYNQLGNESAALKYRNKADRVMQYKVQ